MVMFRVVMGCYEWLVVTGFRVVSSSYGLVMSGYKWLWVVMSGYEWL